MSPFVSASESHLFFDLSKTRGCPQLAVFSSRLFYRTLLLIFSMRCGIRSTIEVTYQCGVQIASLICRYVEYITRTENDRTLKLIQSLQWSNIRDLTMCCWCILSCIRKVPKNIAGTCFWYLNFDATRVRYVQASHWSGSQACSLVDIDVKILNVHSSIVKWKAQYRVSPWRQV